MSEKGSTVEFTGGEIISIVKGRIAFPTRYRDAFKEVDEQVALTADPAGCLLMMPLATWKPIRERIQIAAQRSSKARWRRTVMIGSERTDKFDGAGRILLTRNLLEHAGMTDRVYLAGVGSHFELWSDAGWAKANQKARDMDNAEDIDDEALI